MKCFQVIVIFLITFIMYWQCLYSNIFFTSDNRTCVFVCSYISEMTIQMEEEDMCMSRVVRTSIATVTYVSIKFVESEGRK